jgi:nucleoid DNA-binding protein
MKMPELSEAIGEMSGVPAKTTQRVLRSLFTHLLAEIETKDEVLLPSLGRLVKRQSPDGKSRILFIPRKPATESAPEA